jgi:hypothetical protein
MKKAIMYYISPKRIVMTAACMLFIFNSGCLYFRNHPVGIASQAKESGSLKYEIIGDAEGTSSSFTLVWFFPVTSRISYDEAVNEAIRSKGGDNLIDVTSWREKNVYIVGTVDVLHVKGKAIRYLR